jgi:hypothetical protein
MEKNNIYTNKIISQLSKRGIISPFLFLGNNLDLVNEKVKSIALELCFFYDIPNVNIFEFLDN